MKAHPWPKAHSSLTLPWWLVGCVAFSASLAACNSRGDVAGPSTSSSVQPKTPDRLAPGELAEGKTDLFGLKLPVGMKTQGSFPTSAQASGRVSIDQLTNYVQARIEVARAELAGAATVFDRASIRGAPADRRFRIEIVPKGRETKLVVEWLNPSKPPAERGLSQAERWQRAGLTPDGKMLNPQDLE